MASNKRDSSTYLNDVPKDRWVIGIDLTGQRFPHDFEVITDCETLEEARREHAVACSLWKDDVILLLEPEDRKE